uniref:Non-specific protein-tyrosine kinase n=1 Tax=Caenorhabditis tropicalis TaxID=1561998 RepID=A0A1I7UWE5_9PELO
MNYPTSGGDMKQTLKPKNVAPIQKKVTIKEPVQKDNSNQKVKETPKLIVEQPPAEPKENVRKMTPSTFHMTRGVIPPSKWAPQAYRLSFTDFGTLILRLVCAKKEKPGPLKSGLIQMPEEYTSQPKPLEDEEYFHGFLMDKEVDPINAEEGTFLVRKAQTYCGLKYVLNVQAADDMYNVLINVTEEIELENLLGAGQFGEVYKGYLELSFNKGRRLVAVKMVKGENLSTQQMYDLIKEADNMKKLQHPHIVKFYGIATSRYPFMVALEFCDNGPLDNKLRDKVSSLRSKNSKEDSRTQVIAKRSDFCIRRLSEWNTFTMLKSSMGIGSFESSFILLILRDLAARNCLLTKNNSIKISDFGLSNAEGAKLKEGLLPQRYMAPEALESMVQTKESDVWAFSVLIFEVFHRAFGPFHEYNPDNLVIRFVKTDELKMYLFQRPREETLPEGISLDKTSWYQTLDKPKNPMIQRRIGILFDQLRHTFLFISSQDSLNSDTEM